MVNGLDGQTAGEFLAELITSAGTLPTGLDASDTWLEYLRWQWEVAMAQTEGLSVTDDRIVSDSGGYGAIQLSAERVIQINLLPLGAPGDGPSFPIDSRIMSAMLDIVAATFR